MSLIIPDKNFSLNNKISENIVICFCSSWCQTCNEYMQILDNLSEDFKQYSFIWLDIDDHEYFIGDEDIKNFPTILIYNSRKTVFFGHISSNKLILKNILNILNKDSPYIDNKFPILNKVLFSRN